MNRHLGIGLVISLAALTGCGLGSGVGSSAAHTSSIGEQSSAEASGDVAMISSYPRVRLQQAAPGSGDSLLSLEMAISDDTGGPIRYEVLVDGVSRGVVTAGTWLPTESWVISPGRHRLTVRVDPDDEHHETDESNNESLVIVDVPTATRPAPSDGTDLAYAYPPYVTYTPLEQPTAPQVWAFMIHVPMRNNGTTSIPRMDIQASGDYTGSAATASSYGPGAETEVGIGRGAAANEHFLVDLALDPEGGLTESDEGNDHASLDFVTPAGPMSFNG